MSEKRKKSISKNAKRRSAPRQRKRGGHVEADANEANAHFNRAYALEDSNVAAARAGYLAALRTSSEHLDARINLGRLLHMNGELQAAERVYRKAKRKSAVLSFNLAVLLEDLHREEEAVAAYREAVALEPAHHDAHFNLSRLHRQAARPKEELRHLLAYRRLVARQAKH